ncbi:hypothetical protein IWW50_001096 [Coemansia erecta]|nr:hypothetical protein GGF43_000843 [Coemansia sp. RSA 2618]KAJ2828987.1 hypothetical protein IWW50_001096 [Coemansia erecta]
MAPITRRQSRRLSEKGTSQNTTRPSNTSERPATRDSLSSVAGSTAGGGSGRVAKPERKGRVIASRYMSAAVKQRTTNSPATTPKPAHATRPASRQTSVSTHTKTAPSNTVASRQRPVLKAAPKAVSNQQLSSAQKPDTCVEPKKPDAAASARLARRESRRATTAPSSHATTTTTHSSQYASYLQWQLLEARSQMAFDSAKTHASETLAQLSSDATAARHVLLDSERKLKLMRELAALTRWMSHNRESLAGMGAQVERVREPYGRFAEQLERTTRAMPVSDVHVGDTQTVVRGMHGFVDAVERSFPRGEPPVERMYEVAGKLSRFYKAKRQEQELLCECRRLREALEHTTALALSRGAVDQL